MCSTKAHDLKQKQQHSKHRRRTHQVTLGEDGTDATEYLMYYTPSACIKPLLVNMTIDSAEAQMEVSHSLYYQQVHLQQSLAS